MSAISTRYIKTTKFYRIPGYTIHNTSCPTYNIGSNIIIDNILTKGFKTFYTLICPESKIEPEKVLLTYGSDHLPITLNIS